MASGKSMVGFAVDWWLGWFDTAMSGGDGGGVVGQSEGKDKEKEMNSEKKIINRCL